MPTRAVRLGLTGGIGSGKSTVATFLKARGATLIDADAISRASTAPGGAAIEPITVHFGPKILDVTGALDRNAARQQMFSDASIKSLLESIIHPIVRAEIARQSSLAERNQAACIVFDIPLLVESGHWRETLNRILVVDCLQSTQLARVTQRSSLAPDDILKIIANQATRTQRLGIADVVVYNDAITIDQLEHTVGEIAPLFGL